MLTDQDRTALLSVGLLAGLVLMLSETPPTLEVDIYVRPAGDPPTPPSGGSNGCQ